MSPSLLSPLGGVYGTRTGGCSIFHQKLLFRSGLRSRGLSAHRPKRTTGRRVAAFGRGRLWPGAPLAFLARGYNYVSLLPPLTMQDMTPKNVTEMTRNRRGTASTRCAAHPRSILGSEKNRPKSRQKVIETNLN